MGQLAESVLRDLQPEWIASSSERHPVQPGNSYNWQVSANVGSAQVGRCDMSFTAGPPPLGP